MALLVAELCGQPPDRRLAAALPRMSSRVS
jgi:hypothetical protein